MVRFALLPFFLALAFYILVGETVYVCVHIVLFISDILQFLLPEE